MLCRPDGDTHDERGSLARFALNFHGSAVGLYNLLYQIQAEPGAMDLISYRSLSTEKCVKYVLLLVPRNPRSVIGDADFDGGAVLSLHPAREDADPLLCIRSVSHGVTDEIL